MPHPSPSSSQHFAALFELLQRLLPLRYVQVRAFSVVGGLNSRANVPYCRRVPFSFLFNPWWLLFPPDPNWESVPFLFFLFPFSRSAGTSAQGFNCSSLFLPFPRSCVQVEGFIVVIIINLLLLLVLSCWPRPDDPFADQVPPEIATLTDPA